MLVAKTASPPYVAVIESEPTGRLETSNVAAVTPVALVVTGELPRGSPLAKKETEPVGPDPDTGTTVAVNGTPCPKRRPAATELETPVEVAVGGPPPMSPTSSACE